MTTGSSQTEQATSKNAASSLPPACQHHIAQNPQLHYDFSRALARLEAGDPSQAVSIGRDATQVLVVLSDVRISRYHAFIRRDSTQRFTVLDNNSRNGTIVERDGRKAKVPSEGIPLKRGDIIVLADHALVFDPYPFITTSENSEKTTAASVTKKPAAITSQSDFDYLVDSLSVHEAVQLGRDGKSCVLLNDEGVSRVHASLERHADHIYRLCDEQSKNGTFLNGNKVVDQPVTLQEGDSVRFGSVETYTFHDPKITLWLEAASWMRKLAGTQPVRIVSPEKKKLRGVLLKPGVARELHVFLTPAEVKTNASIPEGATPHLTIAGEHIEPFLEYNPELKEQLLLHAANAGIPLQEKLTTSMTSGVFSAETDLQVLLPAAFTFGRTISGADGITGTFSGVHKGATSLRHSAQEESCLEFATTLLLNPDLLPDRQVYLLDALGSFSSWKLEASLPSRNEVALSRELTEEQQALGLASEAVAPYWQVRLPRELQHATESLLKGNPQLLPKSLLLRKESGSPAEYLLQESDLEQAVLYSPQRQEGDSTQETISVRKLVEYNRDILLGYPPCTASLVSETPGWQFPSGATLLARRYECASTALPTLSVTLPGVIDQRETLEHLLRTLTDHPFPWDTFSLAHIVVEPTSGDYSGQCVSVVDIGDSNYTITFSAGEAAITSSVISHAAGLLLLLKAGHQFGPPQTWSSCMIEEAGISAYGDGDPTRDFSEYTAGFLATKRLSTQCHQHFLDTYPSRTTIFRSILERVSLI